MFKNIEEIEEYIEWETTLIVEEPERCCVCGRELLDEAGWNQYYLAEDYCDGKFCSEQCIKDYLIAYHLEEGDE